MDLDRIAQAFAAGFTVGRAMAMDAARDGEEDGHWVTVGAEAGPDGEKHGGRPVFIKGAKKKAAKAESKKAESKKAGAKKPAIKAAEDKYNLSIGDFLKSQKHAPGSFAKELMYCLPGKADTFEKLCANLSDDCKYLVKHALSSVKYHVL